MWWGAVVIAVAFACPALAQETATKPAGAPGPASRAEDPAAIRTQIEDLLRRINTAVGAADQSAYLACISTADSCFATEQKNWALDLGRKAPQSFSVEISGDEVTLDADGVAETRIKWAWRMPEAKKERTLSFVGRFVRGETGWLYAGEKWKVIEGERCRVFYVEGLEDAAQCVAEVLPPIRSAAHKDFGLEDDKNITERIQQVKLYSSMKHLQHSIYLSYSDGLSGWNEPSEAVKILARPTTDKGFLRMLLGHEYGHVSTFELGPKASDMPWWALEGMAELTAEPYAKNGASNERKIRRWAAAGDLRKWDQLADFHGEATNHSQHVYDQGHSMVTYLSSRFGRDKLNSWLRDMAQGAKIGDASQKVLGTGFDQIDKEWRESLKPVKESEPPAKETEKEPAGAP
jgi:hypothetical protein